MRKEYSRLVILSSPLSKISRVVGGARPSQLSKDRLGVGVHLKHDKILSLSNSIARPLFLQSLGQNLRYSDQ